MTDFVARVLSKIDSDCVSESCSKDRCSVSMNGVPSNRAIIDLDHKSFSSQSQYGQKRCDYLVVCQRDPSVWIAPIELKSGGFEASSVIKQLQAGADQAKSLLADCHSFILVPVVARRRRKQGLHRRDAKLFRTKKISLSGKKRLPILIECGERLESALNQ